MTIPPACLRSGLRLGPLRDGDQVALRAEEERPLRDGWRRPPSFAGYPDLAHRVYGEQLERRARLDDIDVAVFAGNVDFSVCRDRRGRETGSSGSETFLIEALACLHFITAQHAIDAADIEVVAIHERRLHVTAVTWVTPRNVDVGGLLSLQRDISRGIEADRVNGRRSAVGVRDKNQTVGHDRRGHRDIPAAR